MWSYVLCGSLMQITDTIIWCYNSPEHPDKYSPVMQNTPGHDEACSTPCYFVCRIQTKLDDKTSRTYICIKENNIGHMMNNTSHLRLPLFLWNFVVSSPGSGVTLWSAMIETNRLVLLNREAPVVPTDSARTDRIRNALTAWFRTSIGFFCMTIRICWTPQ